MSKVTITIDDTNPAIVAAFGADSLSSIADQFGYMEMVEVPESELPQKVQVEVTDPQSGDTVTELQYPTGTEMFKPNPMTRGEFVGKKMLELHIAPALVEAMAKRVREEAAKTAEAQINQAKDVVKNAAVIEAI